LNLPLKPMLPPAMSSAPLARLEELLTGCESYLEYGCGGSTTLAAKLGVKNIIYCDSSNEWIDSVSKFICSYPEINSFPVFVDIGLVVEWGRPQDQSKAVFWKNYCYKLWIIAKNNNINPELVLIDGRFRVACFLASMMFGKSGTKILFDDYCNREYYKIIETIIKPIHIYDTLAEFVIPAQFDRNASLLMLLEYVNISD